MRLVDELARLWNDTRMRLPPSAWSWPLIAAAGGALLVLVGPGWPERPGEATAQASANVAAAPIAARAGCEDQTWPFLNDDCLRGAPAKPVRVLQYEPALAAAAVGATQWAPKATPSSRQPPPRHNKQATRDPDRAETARSGRRGRNAARERTYAVPGDAFSAYGSARR
jgi:hypothetical protein